MMADTATPPPGHLESYVDPSSTAVIVVDVQNDFVHDAGKSANLGADIAAAQVAVEQLNQLINAAHNFAVPVAYLRLERSPSTDRPNYKARYERRSIDPDDLLCAAGSWGADFYDRLVPPDPARDVVLVKHDYDGFQDTALHDTLQSRGIRNLIMTGLVTNLCVQTTAEHGFGLGYYIVLAEDAMAGDDTAAHEAALRNLKAYFGEGATTEQIIECWQRTTGQTKEKEI